MHGRATRLVLETYVAVRAALGITGRRPDFLIIGAQKAGTTSLYNQLTRHPDVARCLGQEVHYFDRHMHRSPAWYFAHFRPRLFASDGVVTGESTPYYLFHPRAAERVAELLPDVKLIVLLRDPVARDISH